MLNILPIPCHQIRQLSCIEYQPAAQQGPLFLSKEKFPLLERCVFVSSDARAQSSNQVSISDRLEHDRVMHLTTSQADVLSAFSFPALRTLALGDPADKPDRPYFTCESSEMIFEGVFDFLSASRCSLVSLTVSYAFSLVEEFLSILRIVPTLEILDMRVAWSNGKKCDEILSRFFRGLGKRGDDSVFLVLPALQDLRLSIAAQYWITEDVKDYHFYRYDLLHEFCFISKVFVGITKRSKYSSNFRVFSSTMSSDESSRWWLSQGDFNRLQDLKLTKFLIEGPLLQSWEEQDEEEDDDD